MTVSTLNNRVSYAGNGVTTVFSFPNRFLLDADLVVIDVLDSTGAETTKTLTTHYTVTGAGGASGGSVTMLTAPATGHTLVIYRDPALTQPIDLVNGDDLDVDTGIERGLDRNTLQIQRLRDLVDRSMRLSDGDTSGADVELPIPVANRLLGWNSGATAIENKVPADLALTTVTAFAATLLDDATAAAARTTLAALGDDFDLLTAETVPDTADLLALRDISAGTTDKLTLANLLKVINTLAADTATDTAADYLVAYDASATAAKKVLVGAVGAAIVGSAKSLTIANNATNPTYQLDLAATEIVLKNSDGAAVCPQTWSVTVDITAAGANGLDTGAEAGDTWYYVWAIYDGANKRGLLSASSTAPTLPTGYTYKALLGAVRNDGSSNFRVFRQFGKKVFYTAEQSALSGGVATAETAIATSGFVPPNAEEVSAHARLTSTTLSNEAATLRVVTGVDYLIAGMAGNNASIQRNDVAFSAPNIAQNLYYLWSGASGTPALTLNILGFVLP